MKCCINGKEEMVRYTAVNTPPYQGFTKNYYVICSMEEKLHIEIAYEKEVRSVRVRPASAGIVGKVEGNKVVLELDKPCNLSVEINDSIAQEDCLMIFASEAKEYDFAGYEHIIRFDEPVYDIDNLVIDQDNTLIYLAEGTIVNGRIHARKVENLKICGKGVLSMEKYPRSMPEENLRCLDIWESSRVQVEDICIVDSCMWSFRLNGCEDVEISNVKIIGSRGNSDGIDVCGSRGVHVKDCFIRVYDDCLVVKAFDTGNVEDILFEKCTLWNDMARPIEVGVELRCDEVKNVVFRDMDVIHSLTCYPIFGIHHGDRAKLSDIYFENIRVEHAPGAQLFDFRITDSVWNTDTQKGNIRNVTVKDIFLVGEEGKDFRTLRARIDGFSEEADIQDVHIQNVVAFGTPVNNREMLGLEIVGHVKNVTLQDEESSYEHVESRLSGVDSFELREDGRYHGWIRMELINHKREETQGIAGIRVFPKYKASVNEETFSYQLAAGERMEKYFEVITTPGKLAVESFGNSITFKSCVAYIPLAYELFESVEEAPVVCFDNYFGENYGEVRFALRNGYLEMASEFLKEYPIVLYAAPVAVPEDNEVMFSVEESYFGEAPSVKLKDGKLVCAPEIGNHYEITYVFLNQPKVTVKEVHIEKHLGGTVRVPLKSLGLEKETTEFLLEVKLGIQAPYAMPITLFRSTLPSKTAHMYCRMISAK